MLVEVIQGIREGWRRGDIRDLPENVAADFIRLGYVKATTKKRERFGQDKSLAASNRKKGKRPTAKAVTSG